MALHPPVAQKPINDLVSKTPCNIHSLAIIADKVQISGSHPVDIGKNTVLHPYAKIVATGGSVSIGKNCSISEKAVVGVAEGQGDVVIGDNVNIETGAVVEAKSVGHNTTIAVGAKIAKGAVVGEYCNVAPLEEVGVEEELADFTVVFSNNQRRHDQTMAENEGVRQAKHKTQMMQLELLHKLVVDSSAKWR